MTLQTLGAAPRPARAAAIALDHLAVRRLLPHRSPLLMVDRVDGYHPAERRLVATKHVSQNDPFLQGHFPEFPIFPGVLVVESLAQACMLLMHLDALLPPGTTRDGVDALVRGFRPRYAVLAESRVKHASPSFPGDTVRLEVEMTGGDERIRTFRVKALTAAGEGASQGRISIAASPEALSA